MAARLIVAGSLLSGFLIVAVVFAGILAFSPNVVTASATPTPTQAIGSPNVSPSPRTTPASPSPGASVSAPPASGPSGRPPSPAPTPVSAFRVGQPAPALVLPRLDGGTTDITSLRGHPVWVTFMASYYPASRNDFPVIQRFVDRYGPQGLNVLAVDVREGTPVIRAFMNTVGATFPVLLDSDGAAKERWAAFALPIHFWIDGDGIIRDGALGELGADRMALGLESIMPGVAVVP